jgi:hypothetical protein
MLHEKVNNIFPDGGATLCLELAMNTTLTTRQLKHSHTYYDEQRICKNVSVEVFTAYFQVPSYRSFPDFYYIFTNCLPKAIL